MYKSVSFHGTLNERTGYGIHATRFIEQLSKLIPVNIDGEGEVHVSLLDVVTASQITTFPPSPSILYTVWESTEYPQEFINNLVHYDQLWVPSEWAKAAAIAQGIPEELIRVVLEGVDREVYKPQEIPPPRMEGIDFNFLHVGQWQPRKSTLEIIQSFLKAFPDNPNVRLYLSVDTLFPSDQYKSTEERLVANGITDPRIIPVHYEERESYIRRLQSAHCSVSCARAEGWGLPIIESMACGIPTILADWSGPTEYAPDFLRVKIKELRKPQGIYGNWDVPGKWAEPDYDHLVEVMKDAYTNYSAYKEKALAYSDTIRAKFSWAEAAKKALSTLEELSLQPLAANITPIPPTYLLPAVTPESEIRKYARSLGYEISGLQKKRVIFTVDSHPDNPEKMACLAETIQQIKSYGYPVLVATHYPLTAEVIEMCDYYIYDKRDILSGDDLPVYWRQRPDGTVETTKASIPCHALGATHNVRNAVDFCLGKYDWIYHMSSDCEADLDEWLAKVTASTKPLLGTQWNHEADTFGGQLIAGRIDIMDKIIKHIDTWPEFAQIFGEDRFCSEKGLYKIVARDIGLENVEFIDIELGNRFDQVDRNAWKEELYTCHFIDGAFLGVSGSLQETEYLVKFSNPVDGDNYYSTTIKSGMWARPDKKYYRDWTVSVIKEGRETFRHKLTLENQNVIISFGSKALGDTIAWMPYIEEFRKKHNCKIHCSTWWGGILDYPEIHYIHPGDAVENVYASYEIGCFDSQLDKNVTDWRVTPLQKVAADILGLDDYQPMRTKLKYTPYIPKGNGNPPKPYICFSEYSTMRCKFWNRDGAWQKIIDYLNSLGYDCVSISVEPTTLANVIKHNGQSIEQTLTDLSGAQFYIGLNAGPTWLATAMNLPVIMITGVAEPWNDFPNPYRVSVDVCRPGCFNDPSIPIDRGFEWCPRNHDYACTREITEQMVIEMIDKLREENFHAPKTGKVKRSRIVKHKGDDDVRPLTRSGSRSSNAQRRKRQGEKREAQDAI